MASDEHGDKTELPTDRRRQQARDEGNVARSMDLNAATLMLGATTAMFLLGSTFFTQFGRFTESALVTMMTVRLERGDALVRVIGFSRLAMQIALPAFAALFLTAVASNLIQVGVLFSPQVLQWKWQRINPIEGFKRIASVRSAMKLGVSLGKLLIMTAISVWFIAVRFAAAAELTGASPAEIAATIGWWIVLLGFQLSLALIALAVLDFFFQRWKHEQDLRMTKQEVRDEMKNMEGDPLIRQRRRDAHRKLAQARDLANVPKADVVVTNPTHYSIAIRYDQATMPAPTVLAKGVDEMAMRIREIARQHDIPIVERPEIARALYRDVKVGQAIPVEMYEVFVEIMAYVYRITGRA